MPTVPDYQGVSRIQTEFWVWGESVVYMMMAKPIKTLELNYPMIYFFQKQIIIFTRRINLFSSRTHMNVELKQDYNHLKSLMKIQLV